MPGLKIKAVPIEESDEDDISSDELASKKIKLKKDVSDTKHPTKRFTAGIVISTDSEINEHSASASLSAAEKKGLKEVEELERELDLKNTFSKETNRRDEDAEMNKYIEEQIRLKREAAKKERQRLEEKVAPATTTRHEDNELSEMFTLPTSTTDNIDDILLHSLSKHLTSSADERSEAMLSSQMLNGIPEVDLGINERIRTIEATEEAKLRMASSSNSKYQSRKSSAVPVNYSSNFQQHRCNRDTHDGELKTTRNDKHATLNNEAKVVTEAVVVVGQEPHEVEYRLPNTGKERPPPRGKASDDYYLSKFKKNNRK